MPDKYYYKIINDTTNEVDCYVSVDLPVKPEKLCETLCLKGYHAEPTTKDEYEKNTEEVEEVGAENALELINRQKAEIERLEKERQILQDQCDYWRTEVKTTRLELIQVPKKSYKEFAERLKKETFKINYCGSVYNVVDTAEIDNLLKEMAGDGK